MFKWESRAYLFIYFDLKKLWTVRFKEAKARLVTLWLPLFYEQSESSAVWLPTASGRDTASFQQSSFLNLPPSGQHVLTPQSGHGGFAIYHAPQPMGGPAPGLPLLQQSQPPAGPVESIGPPSNSYQQPQHQQQINRDM